MRHQSPPAATRTGAPPCEQQLTPRLYGCGTCLACQIGKGWGLCERPTTTPPAPAHLAKSKGAVHMAFGGDMACKSPRWALVPRQVRAYCRAYGRASMPTDRLMKVTGRREEVTCGSCLRSMGAVPRSLRGSVVDA